METTTGVQRWQYTYLYVNVSPLSSESRKEFNAELDQQGAKGWELVQVLDFSGHGLMAVFKRPDPSQPAES